MEDLLLDVKHLKKYFDTPSGLLHAVDDVSFSVKRGTTLGVVGESGCGKSTLGSRFYTLTSPRAARSCLRERTFRVWERRNSNGYAPECR